MCKGNEMAKIQWKEFLRIIGGENIENISSNSFTNCEEAACSWKQRVWLETFTNSKVDHQSTFKFFAHIRRIGCAFFLRGQLSLFSQRILKNQLCIKPAELQYISHLRLPFDPSRKLQLDSNYCPGRRKFKFLLPSNAFVNIGRTEVSGMWRVKADSHIACRVHAVPLPCRAAKDLECVFPIWFTQCGRVWFTLAISCPCHSLTMPFSQGHGTARPSLDGRAVPWPWEERYGRSMAWAWHGNCKSDTAALCKSNGKETF